MEEVTSNLTIAVTMVYLFCLEVVYFDQILKNVGDRARWGRGYYSPVHLFGRSEGGGRCCSRASSSGVFGIQEGFRAFQHPQLRPILAIIKRESFIDLQTASHWLFQKQGPNATINLCT